MGQEAWRREEGAWGSQEEVERGLAVGKVERPWGSDQ